MKYISTQQLLSLLQSRTSQDVPKSVMDHWYTMYGKEYEEEQKENIKKEEPSNEHG